MATNQESLTNKNASKFTSSSEDFTDPNFSLLKSQRKFWRVVDKPQHIKNFPVVVRLAERFKALDLRSNTQNVCVGSNPTSDKDFF